MRPSMLRLPALRRFGQTWRVAWTHKRGPLCNTFGYGAGKAPHVIMELCGLGLPMQLCGKWAVRTVNLVFGHATLETEAVVVCIQPVVQSACADISWNHVYVTHPERRASGNYRSGPANDW